MSAAKPTKKTIYVDVDEEITGIIDKVRSADEQILALVLPKRASMLQSVVNMKLLKRSADHTEKRVVLITSEATLLPLAGAAGLHVAANLQSRPYIPSLPGAAPSAAATAAAAKADTDAFDPTVAIGDLAETKNATAVEPIEIDNVPQDPVIPIADVPSKPKKAPKDKTKKVPNFQRFRLLLIAGLVLLIALIVGGYYAFAIAPKATVTLRTESSQVQAQAAFSADTDQDSLDTSNKVLPAKSKDIKKTETEKVAASGTRDDGTKAGGNVKLRNCTNDKVIIPAGTGVSNGSQTFITQNAVELNDGNFSGGANGQCKTSGDHTGDVKIVAQNNGDQYNLSARSYTIAGFSGVVAEGEAMTGGTTKTIRIVAQADIDAAKKRIADRQNSEVEELKNALKQDNFVGLVDTFSLGNPVYTPTPAVGSEATEVTVSSDVTYTMLGVKEDDLKKILVEESKDKIDTSKQSVLSYGLDDATYDVGKKSGTITAIAIKSTLVAGPEIDQNALKTDIAGKSKDDTVSTLKARPGITDVTVELKPFWVKKIPGKSAKVNLVVEQANGDKITQ